MEPRNVAFAHIAALLATLGGCTKAEPASMKADQAPQGATSAAATPPPPPPGAAPTLADEESTKGKKADVAASASATPVAPMHRAPVTGQASCGAGTCSADMKKKK